MTLSILDLATVAHGETIGESLAGSVALAQRAEELGYHRVWYAEHHSIRAIASSATAVLVAHVAAHTTRIRLGAGGIMLPNHAPLLIAEQFGTLASLHPDRIDLGLGRAPGSDQRTMQALRRSPAAADTFPQDVLELQAFLSDTSPIPGVHAVPGEGTNVPLYILGSSLYGAQLAAVLGLPYGFASHFAPRSLEPAVRIYRERFAPSEQNDRPHVIAGINVVIATDDDAAQEQLARTRRSRVRALFGRDDRRLTDDEVTAILASPQGAAVDEMLTYTAVGTPGRVAAYLEDFRTRAGADELIVVLNADTVEGRLHAADLLAGAVLAR